MARGWSRDRWINWMSNEHYFTGTADYIVFKDGNYIKVKDGNTGKIVYKSNEANKAIQWAVDELTKGGVINIRAGIYEIHKAITVDNNGIKIIGANQNPTDWTATTLNLADQVNDSMFHINGKYFNMRDITLFGNKNNQSSGYWDGLKYGSDAYDSYLSNVAIMNFKNHGIELTSFGHYFEYVYSEMNDGAGVFVNSAFETIFHHCDFYDNANNNMYIYGKSHRIYVVVSRIERNAGGDGIKIYPSSSSDFPYDIQIIGGSVHFNQEHGIHAVDVRGLKVLGTEIRSNGQKTDNTYNGISLEGLNNGTTESLIFARIDNYNQDYTSYTNKQKYGIYEDSMSDYNKILGISVGNATGSVYVSGVHTVVDVIGYANKNSGTATFSGDGSTTQFTIAHGLVAEPNKVTVTPATSDAAGDFYITKDATNIYVNYNTAPASGTDNVVLLWEAEV